MWARVARERDEDEIARRAREQIKGAEQEATARSYSQEARAKRAGHIYLELPRACEPLDDSVAEVKHAQRAPNDSARGALLARERRA